MPTALVIHAEHDRSLVENEVVPTLAINGFRAELFSAAATATARKARAAAPSWRHTIDLYVTVVSKQAQDCRWMASTVHITLGHQAMVLPLLLDEMSPGAIHKGLDDLVHSDFRIIGAAARHQLANVLPRRAGAKPVDISDWREDYFYEQLERTVRTLQFGQAAELIDTATEQIERRNLEYSAAGACKVLDLLADNRYWRLMRRFAEALMARQVMQHSPFIQIYERVVAEEQESTEWLKKRTTAQPTVSSMDGPANTHATPADSQMVPILWRTNDPEWTPQHIPDLTATSQMGTIFAGTGSQASLNTLQQDSRVLSLERSRSVAVPECDRSIAFVRGHAVHTSKLEERGDQAIVAVIDDGIDPLHEAFMDVDGTSRIIAVWDQRDDSGSPPSGFSTGTEYREAAIASFVGTGRLPESWPLGRHGTHVTSIAAGRAVAEGFAGGMAPQAKILMVVPRIETHGCAFSYANALRYIEHVCSETNLPVVVNISFGENTGAHDGSSHLESCIDAFSKGGWHPGRVVVTSAGNERGKKTHARVSLTGHSKTHLKWESHQLPREDDELELWFSAVDDYRFRLRSPSGIWTEAVDRDHQLVEGHFDERHGYRLELTPRCPGNKDSRLSVRILARDIGHIRSESWQLEIVRGRMEGAGVLHAWIRRSNVPLVQFTNYQNQDMTLTVPGTAHSVITVGAIEQEEPIYVGDISSFGPTRDHRHKPEVSAPGINIIAARHNSTSGIAAMSGTSMAAPHVTGAIALLLSHMQKSDKQQVNAAQIREALSQRARGSSNGWDCGKGYGVLDAEALVRAF